MDLKRVTVTGADDSVPPALLIELSAKYPFVEWGILMSASTRGMGAERFPSREWRASLVSLARANPGVRISAHLCGTWVREIILKGVWAVFNLDADLMQAAKRVQLNTHAESHDFNVEAMLNGMRDERLMGKQFIFQRDGRNNHLLTHAENAGFDAVPLFDLSHGAGVLPDEWPRGHAFANGAGYAGGLSAENVHEQLQKINAVCGTAPIWIDAETRLRSGSSLDLARVEAYLKAAKPWVEGVPY